jgi:hypothetical protein
VSVLSRLLGRRDSTGAGRVTAVDYTGDDRVAVVGESHYQDALASVAGPKQRGGVQLDTQALLIREPDNPHDANAVAVHLNGAGKVGYLSRTEAVRYGPLLSRLAKSGCAAACEAVVLGGDASRRTQFCVWLHIAPPD